ncbi:MAG: ABC transporter permease [Lentisphaeria bacterium]|nr:ABC transporter permease [Lentisphaeria bacterium]
MMKAFFAIVALTFRNAVRSHIFQLLLALLLICVIVIPVSVSVGKLDDLIRVSLLYSLWAVSIILTLSSLWLGCYLMSFDIDSYQIHMVVSKPVSRITIWLGKWAGINFINIILLLLSGIVIYGIVMIRYNAASEEGLLSDRVTARQNAQSEKERIRSQVLVGRRSFMPRKQDPDAAADFAVKNQLAKLREQGKQPADSEILKIREELRSQIDKLPIEVQPGKAYRWVFENIPADLNDAGLKLRYRPYLGKVATEDQRESHIQWAVYAPHTAQDGTSGLYPVSLTNGPEAHFTGIFHEKSLPPGVITAEGMVLVETANFDRMGGKHYYQQADGPKLLVPVCSFEMNYLRAMLVMMIQLLLLSGLACAFSGFLTMPTAVFMVVSYLLFGSLSMILTDESFFTANIWDHAGKFLASVLLMIVIPLQQFDVTDLLSNGELIEFSLIGELFGKYFLLRGVPLFLLGMFFYWRREMGAAVRK